MTTEQATQEGACAAMSATTDAHDRFQPFVGTFDAEVRMWMGPGEPACSTGVMTNSMVNGGRFLQQIYKGHEGGPFPGFEGIGYWGYNTVDSRYEGFWIDTACTFMQNEQGQVDDSGRVWTMHGSMTGPGGHPMEKRSVITLVDNDHHTLEMYFATPEGEMKGMEIKYARA
ncbi:MAG: DUF1579 domain-containing protein [Planctomycetes bacterium]|nr:DUF1579 domain-containing protein [Planctomycetota bacterium]